MVIIGWLRRAVILGAKFDECRACHVAGPHVLIRRTHWFTLFWVPVLLLWVSHGVLCAQCGDLQGVGFLAMRRALRSGRLPLDRPRPGYEASRLQETPPTDADWELFGVERGASPEVIEARWLEISASLRAAGGDPVALVALEAVRRRLLAADTVTVHPRPDRATLFDTVVANPKKGWFDFYSTKAWPAAVALLLLVGVAATVTRPAAAQAPRTPAVATPTARPAGTAHRCWYTDRSLNGCEDDTSPTMLFGTRTGTLTTCWFVEPLREGQYASCD